MRYSSTYIFFVCKKQGVDFSDGEYANDIFKTLMSLSVIHKYSACLFSQMAINMTFLGVWKNVLFLFGHLESLTFNDVLLPNFERDVLLYVM